jgi:hypothetical protein
MTEERKKQKNEDEKSSADKRIDIMTEYESLLFDSITPNIVVFSEYSMYLMPDVLLISGGVAQKVDTDITSANGSLRIDENVYCSVLCKKYCFKDEENEEYFCLCSCQYISGINQIFH